MVKPGHHIDVQDHLVCVTKGLSSCSDFIAKIYCGVHTPPPDLNMWPHMKKHMFLIIRHNQSTHNPPPFARNLAIGWVRNMTTKIL